MKKIHRKIIQSQANYLSRLVKNIAPVWFVRTDNGGYYIYDTGAEYYKPYLIKERIKYLSNNKKASIMRKVHDENLESLKSIKNYGQTYRIYCTNRSFRFKNIICKELFKK